MFAAIRLMWAAALAELGVAITILATLGSVRAAVLHAYPPGWHPVQEHLLVTAAEAPLVIGLWLWMARANGKGKNRGRAAVAVFSGRGLPRLQPGVKPALPYLHAEQVLAGLGGHGLGSGL